MAIAMDRCIGATMNHIVSKGPDVPECPMFLREQLKDPRADTTLIALGPGNKVAKTFSRRLAGFLGSHIRQGDLSSAAADSVLTQLDSDLQSLFVVQPLTAAVLEEAVAIIGRNSQRRY